MTAWTWKLPRAGVVNVAAVGTSTMRLGSQGTKGGWIQLPASCTKQTQLQMLSEDPDGKNSK